MMTPVEKFEKAIIEFGVESALEYFGTPEDLREEFNELRFLEKEKKRQFEQAVEEYR